MFRAVIQKPATALLPNSGALDIISMVRVVSVALEAMVEAYELCRRAGPPSPFGMSDMQSERSRPMALSQDYVSGSGRRSHWRMSEKSCASYELMLISWVGNSFEVNEV